MRVLLISYHFPPVGGAAVQRSLKLARHLPRYGWEPRVLTSQGETGGRWTPEDATMLAEAEGIDVVRVGEPPSPLPSWRRRVDRILGRPDRATRRWVDAAVAAGPDAARGCDAVLAVLEPYETGLAAVRVARAAGLPLVADLLDPWALDEMRMYPTIVHRRRDLRRMRAVVAGSAAVVPNTTEAGRRMLRAFPRLADHIVAPVPNGYDADDFAGEAPRLPPTSFRIVHTGYLHTEAGLRHRRTRRRRKLLGGAYMPDVDLLTRSHLYLLEAIDLVRRRHPEIGDAIELHLAGVLSEVDRASAAAHPGVRLHGYLPHAETVSLMRSADLLFLPMQNLPPGVRAGIVPGKTYEYLAAGPPILAAVPDGDARDLLAAAGHASLVRPADAESMALVLQGELERWRDGRPAAQARAEVVAAYERKLQAGAIGAVLDGAVA